MRYCSYSLIMVFLLYSSVLDAQTDVSIRKKDFKVDKSGFKEAWNHVTDGDSYYAEKGIWYGSAFYYVTSLRGGFGGLDIYRCRILPPEPVLVIAPPAPSKSDTVIIRDTVVVTTASSYVDGSYRIGLRTEELSLKSLNSDSRQVL